MKVCSVEGCERTDISAKGLCWRHYRALRLYGDPLLARNPGAPTKTKKPCSVPGCDRHAHAKGMCHLHYQRKRNGTDLSMPTRAHDGSAANRRCSVSWCDRLDMGGGLCHTHRARKRKGQDLEAPLNTSRRQYTHNTNPCAVEGCENIVYAKTLCKMHYARSIYKTRRKTLTPVTS